MSLSRSLIIYTGSSVLAGALPLTLLPVLTHHLSDSEYGIVATLMTLITFFTPPLIWGTTAIVSVEYSKLSAEEFKRYVSSLLVIPLVTTVALVMLAAAGAVFFADRLGIPALWFISAPVFVALSLFPQLFSTILRMRNAAFTYAAFEFFTALATVLLSLLFVVSLNLHWQGRLYAIGVTSGLTTLIAVAWLAKQGYITAYSNRAYVRDALKFGAGLLPHDLGNQVIRMSDRLFLVALVGLAGTGQYAVAAQVTSVMLILLAAFNRAWAPYLFPRLESPSTETRREIVRQSYMVIGGFMVLMLAFNALVPLLYDVFVDKKFHPSMAYIPWLTLGYFFTAVYLTYVDYIFYLKKTHVLSIITIVNMSCNLLLNYVFIHLFGAIGSAYAFACTMFLVMILAFGISHALFPMPWLYWLKRRVPS